MTQMIPLKRQIVLGVVMRRIPARVATVMKGRRKNLMRKDIRKANKNNQMVAMRTTNRVECGRKPTICCQKCKVQRGVSPPAHSMLDTDFLRRTNSEIIPDVHLLS